MNKDRKIYKYRINVTKRNEKKEEKEEDKIR